MTDLEIFHNAPPNASKTELKAYLDEACGDDDELRQRVESLFASSSPSSDFLERSPVNSLVDDDAETIGFAQGESVKFHPDITAGTMVGRFELLEKIGEGGFGSVWRAKQTEPVERVAALKIIKPGRDTEDVVRRFEQERQALAVMDHPHIAKVYEAGEIQSGSPYFVMELVEGVPISTYCDEKKLTIRERLELFLPVCRAVQHAHTKGIVHRDLKPSNVMVAEHDGKPNPKVIDFGIAKAVEKLPGANAVETMEGMAVGTLTYMSPEQLLGTTDVDTRSDVFSLGVMLYEILVGETPVTPKELRDAGFAEMERLICEVDPPKPSIRAQTTSQQSATSRNTDSRRLTKRIRGELDWIVMKALEKERNRRYETVSGLAEDIERFLANEPVSAAAPSFAYQVKKLALRHRGKILSAAAIIFLIVAGGVTSSILAVKANQAEAKATQNEHIVAYRLAEDRPARDNAGVGLARLARMIRQNPRNLVAGERLALAMAQRQFPFPAFEPFPGNLLRFSPDGKVLLAGYSVGRDPISFLDTKTGEAVGKSFQPSLHLWDATFSPDGNLVATASGQGSGDPSVVELWDWRNGVRLCGPLTHAAVVEKVTFSPTGDRLLSTDDGGSMKIWDITPENRHETSGVRKAPIEIASRGPVVFSDWSPDGNLIGLAALSRNGSAAEIRDTEGNEVVVVHHNLEQERKNLGGGEIWSVRFSPDSSTFVTSGSDGTARIWSSRTGEMVGLPMRHDDRVGYAEFSPDGRLIVTASWDGTIRVWDSSSGLPVTVPLSLSGRISSAHFDSRGQYVIAGSDQGEVGIWASLTGKQIGPIIRRKGAIVTARFQPSSDQTRFVVGGTSGRARMQTLLSGISEGLILRQNDGTSWRSTGRNVWNASFSPDGSKLVSAASENWVRLWDTKRAVEIAKVANDGGGQSARFSADGKYFLTTSTRSGLRIWKTPGPDEKTIQLHGQPEDQKINVAHAVFSPLRDSKLILGGGRIPARAWLWNFTDEGKVFETALIPDRKDQSYCQWVAFNTEGNLALVVIAGKIGIFSVPNGGLLHIIEQEGAPLEKAFFNPVQPNIITVGPDKTARLWDISEPRNQEKQRLIREFAHNAGVRWADFSSDGTKIVTGSMDETARVRDVATGNPIGLEIRHEGPVVMARFSPDNRRVLTASADKTARLWDSSTGFPLSDPLRHDGKVLFANFGPEGRQVVTTAADTTVRLWHFLPSPELESVPDWVPRWVESVVKLRINDQNEIESLGWKHWTAMKTEVQNLTGNDFYTRVAKWFYQEPSKRTVSPFSAITADEFVASRLAQNRLASLEEAITRAPDDKAVLESLATKLPQIKTKDDAVATLRTEYFRERALSINRAQLTENPADNLELWTSILKLAPTSENFQQADEAIENTENPGITNLQQLIQIYQDNDQSARELELRKKLLSLLGDAPEALDQMEILARRLSDSGRHNEAVEQRRMILSRLPGNDPEHLSRKANISHKIAQELQHLGRSQAAEKAIENAIQWQRQHADHLFQTATDQDSPLIALRILGRWAVEFKNWDTAEDTYREMINRCSQSGREYPLVESLSRMLLACAYLEQGRKSDFQDMGKSMLDRFKQTTTPSMIYNTVLVCGAVDPGVRAQDAWLITGNTTNNSGFMDLARGIAAFRLGKTNEAESRLRSAEGNFRIWSNQYPMAQHGLVLTLIFQHKAKLKNNKGDDPLAEAQKHPKELSGEENWYLRALIRGALPDFRLQRQVDEN